MGVGGDDGRSQETTNLHLLLYGVHADFIVDHRDEKKGPASRRRSIRNVRLLHSTICSLKLASRHAADPGACSLMQNINSFASDVQNK